MSATRSCPDWPALLELAPDLHFKHYTIAEAQLPGEVLVALGDLSKDTEICADLEALAALERRVALLGGRPLCVALAHG